MLRPRRAFADMAAFLTFGVAALVAGCATPAPAEHIIEVTSGRHVTRAELLATLRASDFVLLGELHDNTLHHARRGDLLAALAADGGERPAIVSEHLERGRQVAFGPDLKASLVAAGFDAQGWDWPLHEPLFGAVARAGLALSGGNTTRDLVRQVARAGRMAAPAELGPLLDAAPLTPAAQAALDQDLVDGHCGQLPANRLAGMRDAQRLRDASMWLALRDAGTRPAVLLAGNGHVRLDYGVAQMAARMQPQARVVSVGFVETGTSADAAPYTFVWITARPERVDPCAGMPAIAPAKPAAAPASPPTSPPAMPPVVPPAAATATR